MHILMEGKNLANFFAFAISRGNYSTWYLHYLLLRNSSKSYLKAHQKFYPLACLQVHESSGLFRGPALIQPIRAIYSF